MISLSSQSSQRKPITVQAGSPRILINWLLCKVFFYSQEITKEEAHAFLLIDLCAMFDNSPGRIQMHSACHILNAKPPWEEPTRDDNDAWSTHNKE